MERFDYPPSGEFDRALTYEEMVAFGESVVWPAIDHLYNDMDFRARAQIKERTRLPRKVKEVDIDDNPTRVLIEAESSPRHTVTDEDGESFRVCTAVLSIEEHRPEIKDGIKELMRANYAGEDEEDEDDDDERKRWWKDKDIDWEPWEVRTFYFSTDPGMPFSYYFSVDVQDAEERSPQDRHLWSESDIDDSQPKPETIPEPKAMWRIKKHQQMMDEMKKQLEAREEEVMFSLSWRDCLMIKDALLLMGVPSEKLKMSF